MKYLFLCLVPLSLAACNPLGKTDDEESTPAKATSKTSQNATPTPTPKPGAWMEQKKIGGKLGVKEDRLGVKGDRLDEAAKKR